jgi:hypothetical protein
MEILRDYGWYIVAFLVFCFVLGPPLYFIYKFYKIKQYGGGEFVLLWKITPNGTHIIPKVKKWDRNRVMDKKSIVGTDGKTKDVDFLYLAEEGKTPVTMFPLFTSKALQISLDMMFVVDGDNHCIDLLYEYRERMKLPQKTSSSAAQTASVIKDNSLEQMAGSMNPDAGKGNFQLKGWMVAIASAVIVIGFVAMIWQMNSMSGKVDTLKQLWMTEQGPEEP